MELLFIKHGVRTLSHFNCRYSAIHCASAVPMSSVELQQARDISRAPAVEPEQKKTVANGDMKPLAKPQKGIMGMFGNKAAPKAVDSNKDVKPEPKEEEQAATVSFFYKRVTPAFSLSSVIWPHWANFHSHISFPEHPWFSMPVNFDFLGGSSKEQISSKNQSNGQLFWKPNK